jgi:hypothetical protein
VGQIITQGSVTTAVTLEAATAMNGKGTITIAHVPLQQNLPLRIGQNLPEY